LLVNISGTETQNEIAGFKHVPYNPMHPFQTRLVADATMSVCNDFIDDHLSGYSRNWRFVRSINIRNDHALCIVECATEFLSQRFRARIPVRLKHGQYALATDRSRCLERGSNFRWMMAVVVHQKKPRTVVFDFEPAARVLEPRQRFRDFLKPNPEF